MLAGHGHPAIVAAVSARVAAGTHFAQPVPDIIPVAGELARRFGLPLWRFTNSGTESTLAAVHLMRAATGRARDHQGRGQLPRPPRHRAGVGVPGRRATPVRPTGPRRSASTAPSPPAVAALDPRRPVRPPRRRAAGAARAPRRDRRDDHRAGDDEHRRRAPAARLPRRRSPTLLHTHGALLDVRRGQDRPDDRAGRRHRALRRRARHRVPGQGARRRRAVRRHRRHGRGDGGHHRRDVRAGRHVQRQPADDGRRQGDAARGAHARRRTPTSTTCASELVERVARHARPAPPARLRQRLRGQGRHRVLAGAASATTATSAATTPATATPTGCTSTTAGCSCRRGGRWSSGRCRSSTAPTTSTVAAANLERFARDLRLTSPVRERRDQAGGATS